MRKTIQLLGCLAILAAPFIASPAQAAAQAAPSEEGQRSSWRQQHEAIEQVRDDRESLQGERDRLKMQCMDARGQDRTACEAKSNALRQREMAVHEGRMDLHEKREADREGAHEKKWKEHKAEWSKTKPKGAHHAGKKSGKHKAPTPPTGEVPVE